MYKKLLLIICLFSNLLISSIVYTADTDDTEQYILKSLDINPTFLQDYKYNDMKANRYKYHLSIKSKNQKFVNVVKNIISDDIDVPITLLYLAMAESKFDIKAKSWVKAGGVWQFMPKTAEKFGLQMNMYVDERYDIEKSSKAALTYLKYLHSIFGKWYLAMMAYNCGEGTLLKVIKRAGTDDLLTLLSAKSLPYETKMHIRKIVAMAYFNHKDYLLTSTISRVSTQGGVSLYSIAKAINVKVNYLKYLNPHLKNSFLPPYSSYHLYIPSNKEYVFNKQFNINIARTTKYEIYTVKHGDNLGSIAQIYGINYKIIKDFNNIKNNTIYIGQKLSIPTKHSYAKTIRKTPIKLTSNQIYRVKHGDNLKSIARKYNIYYKIIKDFNKLKSNTIYIGQKLIIPTRHSYAKIIKQKTINTAYLKPTKHIYIVQHGDNLSSIGNKYNIHYEIIKSFNNIKNDKIYTGQKLFIPQISKYSKYTISKGDTLSSISKKHNLKLNTLIKINNLNNTLIIAGESLVIPIS